MIASRRSITVTDFNFNLCIVCRARACSSSDAGCARHARYQAITSPFVLAYGTQALQLVPSNWRSTACSRCAILCVVVLSCARCCNGHGADTGLQPLVQSAHTHALLSTFSEELSSRRPRYGRTAGACAGGGAATTGAADTVAVLVCAESFLTGLSLSTMQVMYCIASFCTTKYVWPGTA